MTEENNFIEKLHGRDMVNTHAVAKKVNEMIDKINIAIAKEEEDEKKKPSTTETEDLVKKEDGKKGKKDKQ